MLPKQDANSVSEFQFCPHFSNWWLYVSLKILIYFSDVSLAIVDHADWLDVMQNRSREGASITTPMRQMIKKLPGTEISYLHTTYFIKNTILLTYTSPLKPFTHRLVGKFDLKKSK